MDKKHPAKAFLLKEIPNHPTDIVSFAARRLGLSRQGVHAHLKRLISDGKVIQTGERKGTRYFLPEAKRLEFTLAIRPGLAEDEVWKKRLVGFVKELPPNVRRIAEYGFTEMLNNVIDHSEAGRAEIAVRIDNGVLEMTIHDAGVGIFMKIQRALQLSDIRESVLHLTKGKFTTDPKRHSGEGIFFTSRAFDEFILTSNGLGFVRHSEEDWLVRAENPIRGTAVRLRIKANSKRALNEVFERYTEEGSFTFTITQVLVQLSKHSDEPFISRSQARRVIFGLEKFKSILLDFKGVPAVGQGFVDEVFRVFQNAHPEIKIEWINANPEVEFMIKHSLGDLPQLSNR